MVVLSEAELRIVLVPLVTPTWPMERMLKLCAGWYRGDSCSTIGKEVGVSKSGIIGKAARMVRHGALSHRPNPREPSPDQSPEAKKLRARQHEQDYRRRKAGLVEYAEQKRLAPLALSRPLKSAPGPERVPYVPPPPKYGRVTECCWPLGEPGRPSFRFCDKPTDPGRPYCHTHVGKAYAKVPAIERSARA